MINLSGPFSCFTDASILILQVPTISLLVPKISTMVAPSFEVLSFTSFLHLGVHQFLPGRPGHKEHSPRVPKSKVCAQIQVLSPNPSFSGPTKIPNYIEIPINYFDYKFYVSLILLSGNEVTEFQSFYLTKLKFLQTGIFTKIPSYTASLICFQSTACILQRWMLQNSSFCCGGGGRGGILSRWRTRRRRTTTNQTPSIVQQHQGHSWSHESLDNNDKTNNNDDDEDDDDNTPSFLNEEIHKLERETNDILDLVRRAREETPSSSLLSLSSSLLSQDSTPVWEEWKTDWDAVEEIAAGEMTATTCQTDNDEDDDNENDDEHDNHMGRQCKEFLLSCK